MGRAIYKYLLALRFDEQTISLPVGAKIVKIAPQKDYICIWAISDENPSISRTEIKYLILATGDEIPYGATYKETVFMGDYVWHVFKLEG